MPKPLLDQILEGQLLIFAKKCPLFERSGEQKFFLSYFVKTYQIFNVDFEEFLFGSC